MGTSHSTRELVGKLNNYGHAIPDANRAGTIAAAMRYKEQALRNVTVDTGGDRRMSQVRNRFGRRNRGDLGPKMGAGFNVHGNTHAKAVLKPRPYGLWALLDGGSVPHKIVPFRYVRGIRRNPGKNEGAAGALKFPGAGRNGNGYTSSVDHPGSKGKRTFRNVPHQAKRAAMVSFQRSHHVELIKRFGK